MGGGGWWGGKGGGVIGSSAAGRGFPRGGGGLRTNHYYHMHTSRGDVCLGAYRGMCAIIALSRLCQDESLSGLKDQRHSNPFNSACNKKFGAVSAMAPAPLSFKTRGWGVAYKDQARPPPPPRLRINPGIKCMGRRAFNWKGGGVDRAPWLDPPPKRGSIDGTPKILPRLTPGPWR